jgi:uncharacterized protein (TIGR02001 family)|tara:strand:- start:300 stop:872 length:573 start_codon:yes stop_codon:yes gene_type:complete
MKKLIPLCLLSVSVSAVELSGNVGYATEYHYRGILQNSESFSAGVDLDAGGFNMGVWTADVGDGAEVDVYSSYTWEVGDLAVSAGMTGYYYTGDFDETYEEVNLGLDYKFLSVEHSMGTWDGEEGMDYDFTAITTNYEAFYATYGIFGKEFSGDYVEVGYGTTFKGIDMGVAYITTDGSDSFIATLGRVF